MSSIEGVSATAVLVFLFVAMAGGGIVLARRLGPFIDSLLDKWEAEITAQGWERDDDAPR